MLFGYKIKEDKLGGSCSTYRVNRNAYKILTRNLKLRSHLKYKDIDKSIILKWMLKNRRRNGGLY
jgi:hypothetical protein